MDSWTVEVALHRRYIQNIGVSWIVGSGEKMTKYFVCGGGGGGGGLLFVGGSDVLHLPPCTLAIGLRVWHLLHSAFIMYPSPCPMYLPLSLKS